MSSESARALLNLRFPADMERRMRDLLERNNCGTLAPDEQAELEDFRRAGSFLAILQARARLKLQDEDTGEIGPA